MFFLSRCVLGRYKYFYVQNLVEYYQMETRWSIRHDNHPTNQLSIRPSVPLQF
jgi:hypothetical protein